MRGVSLAAGASAAGSLKAFGDIEKGVTNVTTLLDDDAAVVKYRGRIEELSKEAVLAGFSIEDSNKALFDSVSALGAGDRAWQAFNVAQKLAKGGVTTLGSSVDGLTTLMAAYKDSNLTAEAAANILFTAQKKGKITVEELNANLGKVLPTAKLAGIGADQVAAATAQLTLGGLNAEEATTALKGAISALVNPSKGAEKVLRKFGVPIGATAIESVGFGEALLKLAQIADGPYKDSLAEAIPNIRALTAVGSLGRAEIENMDAIIKQIALDQKNKTGVDKAATAQMATFNDQMARTFGAVKILAAQIGQGLAPVVLGLGFVVRAVSTTIGALGPVAGKIIAGLLGIIVLASPVLLFMGKFLLVAKAVGVGIAGAFAIAGAPILIIIGSIIAGLSIILVNWDKVKTAFAKAKQFLGFGGEEATVKTVNESSAKLQAQVDMTIKDKGGNVESVQTRSPGAGLNMGVAMAGAG
jgi:TP901 family phage tail tape measure protein